MARFLFASHARFGHVDLGGRSYLRTAAKLRARGHEVSWLLHAREEHVAAAVAAAGVPLTAIAGQPLKLGADHEPEAVARSVRLLAGHLRAAGVGVLVADRVLAAAHLAGRLAGVPWAAFGTDGHPWRRARRDGARVRERGVHEKRAADAERLYDLLGLPAGDEGRMPPSVWLRSPYLTVSFFPFELWHDDPVERLPQAHFVGGPPEGSAGADRRARLVVAAGNTWAGRAVRAVVEALPAVRERRPELEVEVLTGSERLTEELAAAGGLDGVALTTWGDYGEAFRGAVAVAGHGGTAFLWQAMAEGAPVLVVDPDKGDQTANAARVERLGLGRVLRGGEVAPGRVAEALLGLLADEGAREAMGRFARALRSGGGVEAAATLLEALASGGAPVTACPGEPCCCGEGRT